MRTRFVRCFLSGEIFNNSLSFVIDTNNGRFFVPMAVSYPVQIHEMSWEWACVPYGFLFANWQHLKNYQRVSVQQKIIGLFIAKLCLHSYLSRHFRFSIAKKTSSTSIPNEISPKILDITKNAFNNLVTSCIDIIR